MTILTVTEQAVKSAVESALSGVVIDVLLSDSDDNKPPMPYIIVRAKGFEEQISPGSGIFKVNVGLVFKSHVKDTTPEDRKAIVDCLNNFAYSAPATTLSQMSGFHCYGFVPTTGQMTVEPELKAYVYEVDYELFCMARDNA